MPAGEMLKYVRPMVSQVLGTMTTQISTLKEVTGRVRGLLPGIEASWIGEDADAFVREVSQQFLPQAAAVIAAVGGIVAAILRAAEVIEQADREAKAMAEALQQELSRVFS